MTGQEVSYVLGLKNEISTYADKILGSILLGKEGSLQINIGDTNGPHWSLNMEAVKITPKKAVVTKKRAKHPKTKTTTVGKGRKKKAKKK